MDYRTKFVKSITDQLIDLYPDADNISAVGGYIELKIPEELWRRKLFARDFSNAVYKNGLIIYDENILYSYKPNGATEVSASILIGIPNKAGD